jgi:cytochrome bd-type quinol oxidase subunit 2
MLQRAQSVYLFLATLTILAMFVLPIAHNVNINGVSTTFKIDGMYQDVAGHLARTVSFLALTIVCVVLAIIPLLIAFRYQDRKQQIALCYSWMLAFIGFCFWMTQTVKGFADPSTFKFDNFYYGAALPSAALAFVLLAIKGIKNDEKLVKSADRLR